MDNRTARFAAAAAIALSGFAALAVAMGIGRFAFTPLLPMMQDEKGLSIVAGGWLAAANYVGYLAGASLAIGISARHHLAIRTGLVVIGIVSAGMMVTEDFIFWIALRALAGVASAWVLIHVSAWCFERIRQPIVAGVIFGGVGGGIAVAGLLCLLFTIEGWTGDGAWLALGALSLAVAALIWGSFDGPDEPVATGSSIGRKREGMRWGAEIIRLILCYGIFGFSYILPATFLPVMAKQTISDPQTFGWAWPVFGAAACVSAIAASYLRQIVSDRVLWAASHLVMAAGVALPAIWPGLAAILIAALGVGGTFMVATMVALAEAKKIGGRHASPLVAAMTASFAFGQIVAPLGVSLLGDNSIGLALLVASGLLSITALSLIWPFSTSTAGIIR